MPLKLKNAASLTPKSNETVEAVGITLPVYPYLRTAEKLEFAQDDVDFNSPLFLLRAFSIFTRWRCPAEDHVTFDELAQADMTGEEMNAVSTAVARLFAAAKEDEGAGEGKKSRKTSTT